MKLFRSLLLCLALAALGALAWQWLANDTGQVIVSTGDTVYVTTVSKALLLLVLALVLLLAAVALLRLPFHLWQRRRQRQAQACMGGGLLALHEGRWARAEKLLTRAAAHAPFRAAARMAAAQAAQARGDADAAEAHRRASSDVDTDPLLALARAQAQFEDGRSDAALATLDAVAGKAPPSPQALLLRVRALLASGRADEACVRLAALQAAQVLPAAAMEALEASAVAQALAQARDADALAEFWKRLAPASRARNDAVAAYADRAAQFGMEDAATAAIADALDRCWDEALVRQFGRIGCGRDTPPTARLDTVERWIAAHSDSPMLALTIARLAARVPQWGKAEDSAHRALAQGGGAEAWEVLGDVHAARGDVSGAALCYANALRAARGEAVAPLPGRSVRAQIFDAAVAEERDEHGVPRLPASPH